VPFVEFVAAGFRLPGGRALLDAFSLAVEEGETLAVIGRSGSGKTTALKLVNALLMPTMGEVRVAELLALVGLPAAEFAGRYPHQLSGGQRQRVGVARALAADPPLLLLDEPFGALDPITRAELQREFRALQARLRKTAIFVTHDMREAALVGDRIAVVAGGRLRAVATREALRESRDPEVRALVDA